MRKAETSPALQPQEKDIRVEWEEDKKKLWCWRQSVMYFLIYFPFCCAHSFICIFIFHFLLLLAYLSTERTSGPVCVCVFAVRRILSDTHTHSTQCSIISIILCHFVYYLMIALGSFIIIFFSSHRSLRSGFVPPSVCVLYAWLLFSFIMLYFDIIIIYLLRIHATVVHVNINKQKVWGIGYNSTMIYGSMEKLLKSFCREEIVLGATKKTEKRNEKKKQICARG